MKNMLQMGNAAETWVCSILRDAGFVIEQDPNLDQVAKLDFVIQRHKSALKYTPMGVQVTLRRNDAKKIAGFVETQERLKPIPRSAYVELAADPSDALAPIVLGGIWNILFNVGLQSRELLGLTIEERGFRVFDPIQAAAQERGESPNGFDRSEPVRPTSDVRMEGTVKYYRGERGFGFLATEGSPDLYFHVSYCKDMLKQMLEHEPLEKVLGTKVTFLPADPRRGYSNPQAIDVDFFHAVAGSETQMPPPAMEDTEV